MEKQAQSGRKIFAKHISDKILLSRIHEEHLEFMNKKTKNKILMGKNKDLKWAKNLNKYFIKENKQM